MWTEHPDTQAPRPVTAEYLPATGQGPGAALVFTLRGDHYGVLQNSGAVLLPWIQRYSKPGPIPGVPPWLAGLLSVQGTVQAIVDLGAFLDLGPTMPTTGTRIVFIQRDEVCVGLLVDSAAGIRYPETLEMSDSRPIEGAGTPAHETLAALVVGRARVGAEHMHVLDGGGLLDALAPALEPAETEAEAVPLSALPGSTA